MEGEAVAEEKENHGNLESLENQGHQKRLILMWSRERLLIKGRPWKKRHIQNLSQKRS